jgi:glycosyltransferase involved in cell wall biosynthesis
MLSPQFRPIEGGYERAAARLSAGLADEGMRVVIITERRERAWLAVEHIDGYEVRRLPCCYRPHLHTITSVLAFACFLLCHGRNFEIWHVHQYGFHAALAVALGKLLRRPVVLKLTSSAGMGIGKAMGSNAIVKGILGFLHRRVSACLAVSKETREEATWFGIPSSRIHVIHNGVDGHQFPPALPEERVSARLSLNLVCERLVLYVGRLSPEKNPLGLLDAWAAVDTKARENALLALVGDGPAWNHVYTRAQQLNPAAEVYLAGQQSDVATWYRAADIYVIPSHLEGLSNTMIEALASGLPVISTRVSGSSVLLESPVAGFVVNIGDKDQLAGAIECLLRDEDLRKRFGKNARLTFEMRFSLESIVKRTIILYNNVLNRSEKQGTA